MAATHAHPAMDVTIANLSRSNQDLVDAFVRHLRAAGRQPGTIKQRKLYLLHFLASFPEPFEATLSELEAFMSRRRLTLGAEALKSQRTTIRMFYSWCVRNEWILRSPAEYLPSVPVPVTLARRAGDDAVHRALQMASLEEKAMILLGRLAGLRLSEITTLQIEDRDGNMLRVKGKGAKERVVPVPPPLATTLDRLAAKVGGAGYYFPGRFGGHQHFTTVYKAITERLGLNPHSLRHAYATAAYRGTNRDIRSVQTILGHSSPTTTQRYVHVDEDEVLAAALAASAGFTDAGESAIERAS